MTPKYMIQYVIKVAIQNSEDKMKYKIRFLKYY